MPPLGIQFVRMQRRVIIRGIASIGLALPSVGVIYLIGRLPYSNLRDVVSDSLMLPAALIAGVIASGGVHGEHPMLWFYSLIIALPLTCAIFWFAVLSLFARLRGQREH